MAPKSEAIIIDGRYQVFNYEEAFDTADGTPLCDLSLADVRDDHVITLSDRQCDGSLDRLRSDNVVESQQATQQWSFWTSLYQKTNAAVQKQLPQYMAGFVNFFRSRSHEQHEVILIQSAANDDANEIRNIIFTQHDLTRRYFLHAKTKMGSSKVESALVEIGDTVTNMRLKFGVPQTVAGLVAPLLPDLEHLLSLDPFPVDGVSATIDGAWLAYLHSDHFTALNAAAVDIHHMNVGDLGWALANIALEAAENEFLCPDSKGACHDEGGVDLLKKYEGPIDLDAFDAFLKRERAAALSIPQKIARSLWWKNLSEAPRFEFDIVGRPLLVHTDGTRMSMFPQPRSNYVIHALNRLLEERTDGRYALRKKTLEYLDRCLEVHGNEILFVDPEQNHGKPLRLPEAELLLLLFGDLPAYQPGINLDGFYLHDEDGDGKIHARHDNVESKRAHGRSSRSLGKATIDNVLAVLSEDYPPPFDPKLFTTEGVPFSDLRRWADQIHSELITRRIRSETPMEDGAYRTFVFRNSKDDLDVDGFWVRTFRWFNDIDDTYAVPHSWGMELALNEIAGREIPLTKLYIGTHGDQVLKMEPILLDFDRRLTFVEGAEVVFTACLTDDSTAHALGSQLFRYSSGRLLWGDDIVVPLPFGNIMTLAPDGHSFETSFDHGEVRERKTRYLVDPIPGGLF